MIINPIGGIQKNPVAHFEAITLEERSVSDLFLGYILILAAIPPLAGLIGTTQFGWSFAAGATVKLTFASALIDQYRLLPGNTRRDLYPGQTHPVDVAHLRGWPTSGALPCTDIVCSNSHVPDWRPPDLSSDVAKLYCWPAGTGVHRLSAIHRHSDHDAHPPGTGLSVFQRDSGRWHGRPDWTAGEYRDALERWYPARVYSLIPPGSLNDMPLLR